MYQLAIFDLDGTLLDTLADLRQGINYALGTQGFAPRSMAEVRAFVGNGIRKLVERAVPAGTSEAQMDAVYEAFNPYYARHCADLTAPYDGILPLLQKLQAQGVVCALVSNKPDYAVQTLAAQYFRVCSPPPPGRRTACGKSPRRIQSSPSSISWERRGCAPSTSATPRSTCRPRRTRRCPASRSAGASATGRAGAGRSGVHLRHGGRALSGHLQRIKTARGITHAAGVSYFRFSLRQTALTAPMQTQIPPATKTDVKKLHDAPSFLVCSCSGSRGSCASTAQAALYASSAFRPSDCCIRLDSC